MAFFTKSEARAAAAAARGSRTAQTVLREGFERRCFPNRCGLNGTN